MHRPVELRLRLADDILAGRPRRNVRQQQLADIRLRAYFIAERRVQFALHGDPAMDWVEARKQLIEERSQGQA